MANQRKIIGRIPVYRGEWTIDNSPYHKLNDVTLYGCTFRSKIESNSYPPATIGSNGELVVNENWSLISSGYESEKINEDIAFIDKNSSAYNVSRFHIHSGFWEAIEYDESQEAYMEAKEYASGSKVNLVNYTNYTFVAKKAMTGIQPDINNITNKFTLEEAVLFVPNKYQLSGLDIGFISSDTNKPVFHRYNGGLFTSILNWTEDVYEKLTELGKYIENEEYIRAYLDANDKFLWGIRKDGTVEWAKGIPSPIRKALIDLESKLVNENIKDLQNDINAINEQINTINQTFFYTEDEEFIHSVVDSEGNLLFGITKEGKPYYPNNETYHVVENEEFLAAWVDIRNNILFGIKWDGRLYTPTLDFSNELSEIAKLVTAKQDKLVSGQNIKTINGVSVLGEGNIQIEGASGAGVDAANLFLSSKESEEFLNVLVDSDNKILSCTKNYSSKKRIIEDTLDESQIYQSYIGGYIEIQPDSYNSGSVPATDSVTETWGFPYSLTIREQERLRNLLLSGNNTMRYIRLPLGYAYRGYRNIDDSTQLAKNIGERYTGQNQALKDMCKEIVKLGGGLAPEYWCHAPYWITSGTYHGGNEISAGVNSVNGTTQSTPLASIRLSHPEQYSQRISDFADAIVDDLEYLHTEIAPVRMFALQNEPGTGTAEYGACRWDKKTYNDVLEVLIDKIKGSAILSEYEGEPNDVKIHVSSEYATNYDIGSLFIENHPDLIWGYTHHYNLMDNDANLYLYEPYKSSLKGDKPNVINNEFEYFSLSPLLSTKKYRCANNMLRLINEAVYGEAEILHPVIHICKQLGQSSGTSNTEGYAMFECNLQEGYGETIFSETNPGKLGYGEFRINNLHYNSWKMFDDNLSVGAKRIGKSSILIPDVNWCAYIVHGKRVIFIANSSLLDYTLELTIGRHGSFAQKLYNYDVISKSTGDISGTSLKILIPKLSGICLTEY